MDTEISTVIQYLRLTKDYTILLDGLSIESLEELKDAINKKQRLYHKEQAEKRATIPVEIEESSYGTPICVSKNCPEKKSCANHTTAGDFREEDGFTPNLHLIGGKWLCEQKPTQAHGILIKTEKGEWKSWEGYRDLPARGRQIRTAD